MISNKPSASCSKAQPVQVMCHYNLYTCTQSCLDGYSYCLDHITEDRNSPYRPCTFVFANGKRCTNNVLKGERRDGLCSDHAKRSALCKMKSLRKRQPPECLESLVEFHHYDVGKDDQPGTSINLERLAINSASQKLLDYASETDSEEEVPTVDQTMRQEDDSDAESVDSDQDDPLRHAGVYTPEEVVLLTRDKLVKLQSLYVDQFKRLHYQLKDSRRRYLNEARIEKENGVMNSPYPDTPAERKALQKLKSLQKYQRHRGVEALLHHQLQEKRLQVTQGVNYKAPPTPKCAFVDCGIKCHNAALPLMKHCIRHVMNDSSQMLFRMCGAVINDNHCKEPVIDLSDDARCVYHTVMPPMARVPDTVEPSASPIISVDDDLNAPDPLL